MVLFGAHGAWQSGERLTRETHLAVRQAEMTAAARKLASTTPDILLLALLDDVDGVARRALAASGADVTAVQRALGADALVVGAFDGARSPLDEAAREAVILGVNEARRAGFDRAGLGHVLIGLLEARTGTGVRLIVRQGIRLDVLRDVVDDLERIDTGDGADPFARAFEELLARSGGASACSRCGASLHASFTFCYNCGSHTG